MFNPFGFISQPVTASSFPSASGGTIVTSGLNKIHTFTSSADLTVYNGGLYEVFLVGGGGGGGNSGQRGGGGGGGGGIVNIPRVVLTSSVYPVVVGAGGGFGNPAFPGGTSSLANLVALGGGGGGGNSTAATDGGSGGGGVRFGAAGFASQSLYTGNSGVFGYGQNGGSNSGADNLGAGGGGAGEVGNTDGNGYGGDGLSFDISGTSTFYAGGGGGGWSFAGGTSLPGGDGGGGAGNSGNGGANTGGGGGGANPDNRQGGTGGTGIAIVKYQYTNYPIATGGTITTSGSYKIHEFTSSVDFTITNGVADYPFEYFILGAGGNGGSSLSLTPFYDGGGGAAGTVRTGTINITAGANTIFPVTVGLNASSRTSTWNSISATGGNNGGDANNFGPGGGGSNADYSAGSPSDPNGGGGAGSSANGSGITGGAGTVSTISGASIAYAVGGNGNGGSSSVKGSGGAPNISGGAGSLGKDGIVYIKYQFQA